MDEQLSQPTTTSADKPQNAGPPNRPQHWPWFLAGVILILGTIGFYTHRQPQEKAAGDRYGGGGTNALMISTDTARKGDIGVYVNALGVITPLNTVSVTRAWRGILKVDYQEGEGQDWRSAGGDRSRPLSGRGDTGRRPTGPGHGAVRRRQAESSATGRPLPATRFPASFTIRSSPRCINMKGRCNWIRATWTTPGCNWRIAILLRPLPAASACAWWTPATSCRPPARMRWSSSRSCSRSPPSSPWPRIICRTSARPLPPGNRPLTWTCLTAPRKQLASGTLQTARQPD